MKDYKREVFFNALWKNLHSSVNFIQVVVGPRQIGKTTIALQIMDEWKGSKIYDTADRPDIPNTEWIEARWQEARSQRKVSRTDTLLILDEVQKIPRWSEAVKRLHEEDKRRRKGIRVLLLGSSALLMQRGLSESLAGRFELHQHTHWSYKECHDYFKLNLKEYIYFGGYPAALLLRKDQRRWANYIRDSLIETVLSKDILLMSPISKPALLRQAFGLAVAHPAQILSYQKMLGSLHDAGNTTTIASYLRLLSKAFLVNPLERFSQARIKYRGSIPKLLILDNSLVCAMVGIGFRDAVCDKAFWGRLIENAVGIQLYILAQQLRGELFYWRLRKDEIDYCLRIGKRLIAIEVKSGDHNKTIDGLNFFLKKYKKAEGVLLSPLAIKQARPVRSIKLEDFFSFPKDSLKV